MLCAVKGTGYCSRDNGITCDEVKKHHLVMEWLTLISDFSQDRELKHTDKFPLNKWSRHVVSVHRKTKRFHDPGPKQTYWKGTVKGHKFTDISRWRAEAPTSSRVVSCRSEVFWRSLQNAQQSWLRQLESHQLSNCCPLPLWQRILVGFPLQRALLCLLTFTSFSNIKTFMSTKIPSGTTLCRGMKCIPGESFKYPKLNQIQFCLFNVL